MRVAARFWLLAYLLVAGGAPVLDGAIGHEEPVAHWEDVGGGQCPATHDADDCQVCQLVQSVRASAGGTMPSIDCVVQLAPTAESEFARGGGRTDVESRGPRGPPVA